MEVELMGVLSDIFTQLSNGGGCESINEEYKKLLEVSGMTDVELPQTSCDLQEETAKELGTSQENNIEE